MKVSGIFGDLDVRDEQGDPIDDLTLIGTFPKCQGTEPTSPAAGSQFTECYVYIAPAGKPATSPFTGPRLRLDLRGYNG